MTPKQRQFIDWYCSAKVNMNGTEAARRAGYKGSDTTLASVARENLRKPQIMEEIEVRLSQATAGARVTVEWVLKEIKATYVRATAERKYSVAVRCLELQGKYLKMFSERIEHVESIEDISREELLELMRDLSAKAGISLDAVLSH